ncbi:sterile alpha motif domain-containing protein 3-like [Mytilus galloprovincialis]|uniref:sterile alpha motif domain-containing protein 3-like n=1 Tax=Mytilus galloprovincialis TaxID=29158 RepID=UPI003F7BF21B
MVKLVLSSGNRTKKITCELSIECIKKTVKDKFAILGEFYLQYFDVEVEEWIDLDSENISELDEPDRFFKVKVIAENTKGSDNLDQLPSLVSPSQYRSNTPCSVEGTVSRSVTPVSRPDTPVSRPDTPLPSCFDTLHPDTDTQKTSKKSLTYQLEESPSTSSTRKLSLKIWPREYRLPRHTFSQTTLRKLDERQALDKKEKRDILSGIYTDVTMYEGGFYPTADKYNSIVDSLFRECPYLAHGEGVALQSARDLWKERLLHKFQNSRKRHDKNLPEVKANKRQKTDSTIKIYQGPSTWGLKNYLPDKPLSEDEASVEKHMQWLQKEYRKKDDQDITQVDLLMDLTLHHRRTLVVSQQMDVESILSDYPWLKSTDELIKEFVRLGPSMAEEDVRTIFLRNLDRYAGPILKLTKGRKGGQKADDIIQRQAILRTEQEREAARRCAAILKLPLLFKERVDHLIMPREEIQNCEEPRRIIICQENDVLSRENDAFKVTVENVIVSRSCDMISAVLGLIMAIYTFNLAYPKHIQKTLLFCQRVLLSLDDEVAIDKKILNVTSLLNQEMNK